MKVVLVTGGVRGIGKSIALQFHKKGYRVCVTYSRDEESAKETAALGLETYRVDVSKENEVVALFQKIGKVDILVNNAGVSLVKQIQDVTYEEYNALMSVNMGGAFLCSREASKGMIDQQSGLIVNISSVWGEVGGSCESVYSASKAAVIGMTKALAKELAPSHIRVNCVAPGVIDTDMNACYDEDTMQELADRTPLGRIGTPEDVARVIHFLADDASFITGQVLSVDGGFIL